MIKHSQYFTQKLIASALVKMVPAKGINKVLDLGIGDGALSLAALNRFSEAIVDAMDIDPDICEKYQTESGWNLNVFHGDVLCSDDMNVLNRGSYDLAVCNPPYGSVKKNDDYDEIFFRTSLNGCLELKTLSKDIIFMCRCLDFVREGGYVAIILPDGPLSRKDYFPFRKSLLANYCVERIVQMPEKAFPSTEATTHILVVKKGEMSRDMIPVSLMKADGSIGEACLVDKIQLENRMDYSFCIWHKSFKMKMCHENIQIDIKRGSYSHCNLKKMKFPYLHSTGFSDSQVLNCEDFEYNLSSKVIARKGDIIMCRVGKRCVGKVAMISKGAVLLSDCLYKISVPQDYSSFLFEALSSQNTKIWVSAVAHGVCSRVISKSDLEDYITFILSHIDDSQFSLVYKNNRVLGNYGKKTF